MTEEESQSPQAIDDSDLYCSPTQLVDFLGLNVTLSETSSPTEDQVKMFIKQAMAELERRTKKSWRIKTFEKLVRDIPLAWVNTRGIPIHLSHTDVEPLDHDEGDRIEAWNGTEYVDVTESTRVTELPRLGKLWIRGYLWSWIREDRLKITYRHRSPLTWDVQEACLKLASIKIIERSFRMKTLAFGGNIDPNTIVNQWREDVEMFIAESEEWTVVEA